MSLEKRIYLLKTIQDLIEKYQNSDVLTEKMLYLDDLDKLICSLFDVLKPNYYPFILEIKKVVSSNNMSSIIINHNKDKVSQHKLLYKEEDVNYLRQLTNKIMKLDLDCSSMLRPTKPYETDIKLISKYIEKIAFLQEKYNLDIENVIYDERFGISISIPLHNDKNIILTNSRDITVLLHEFLHGIYPNTLTIYKETPSILGELAIQEKYKIGSSINRLELFTKNALTDLNYFSYLVGFILSKTIIYKYGSDFETVFDFTTLIDNNDQISIEKMLTLIGVTEKDIMSGFTKTKKA